MKTQTQFLLRIFTLALLMSFIIKSVKAQENESSRRIYGGIGYFQTGYAFFNHDNLNELFTSYGMPELQNGSVSFGGGGHSIIRNFIIGGEGHGLTGSTTSNSNYTISQGGGYGFFNLGYLVLQKSIFTLYPLLGFGGGGYSITITDKTDLPTNFNDLLASPQNQSSISKGGFMLNISLGTDFFIAGTSNGDELGGFILGLRAGYLLEFNKDKWYIADQELAGGPDAGISGPFIRLTIGGGGMSK